MSKRREGREAALQLLYSLEFLPGGADHDMEDFWRLRETDDAVREHALELFRGVRGNLTDIDARITAAVQNFSFERLNAVDRNILRIAVFEMFHQEAVPPIVSMNEAIEIAKRFGGQDSGRFVNGVLDRIMVEVKRSHR
jgi:N utilization substance protein B